MKTRMILLIAASLFLFSCGNISDEQSKEQTEAVTHEEHSHDHEMATLELNNGAKWDSDLSTFTGMKKLELTLFNFNENHKNPTLADYNKLGEELANINKDIISQCSMRGIDHDQLHILLAPMLANVDVIKNGQDMVKVKDNTEELSAALVQFFEHFEVK